MTNTRVGTLYIDTLDGETKQSIPVYITMIKKWGININFKIYVCEAEAFFSYMEFMKFLMKQFPKNSISVKKYTPQYWRDEKGFRTRIKLKLGNIKKIIKLLNEDFITTEGIYEKHNICIDFSKSINEVFNEKLVDLI